MKYEIITLFPDYFRRSLRQSLLGKALDKGLFEIEMVNLRDFATDKHRAVDDTPYGGGGGMVMMIEPLDRCLRSLGWKPRTESGAARVDSVLIVTSAAGKRFDQETAVRYSLCRNVTIVCGHYLGIDERLGELYDVEEVSIGDYVLTGGEPAAAVIVDATARLIPKVVGNFESALGDSYMNQMLGSPSFTRPPEYAGLKVPEVLQSGNHAEIRSYRRREAIVRCYANRPDLLEKADLSQEETELLETLRKSK
ncbi:MAG: tRNA (guanosine(37)-N1)-methyltransferase TrmD [Candidatus Zixiibacteriota bacterium]|nr:MAG: tRNA (guanosine(37)-N1)-methyltransferase TrmD [candidate division Zixibacteria bacterium]